MKRRTVIGHLAGLAALLPVSALARKVRTEQIGCPSKCKVDSKGRCCRIYYQETGGVCVRDHKDCSGSAARGCNYCR